MIRVCLYFVCKYTYIHAYIERRVSVMFNLCSSALDD